MDVLLAHTWPGNARELRNVLTRAYVMGGARITPGALVFNPLDAAAAGAVESRPALPSARNAIEEAERDVVLEAYRRCGQNRAQTARELGIPRSTLLYKLRRWGIDDE